MVNKLLNLNKNELFSLAENRILKENVSKKDVAIIGMSGRFGAAENLSQYWEYIKDGKDLITDLSENRQNDCMHYANKFSNKKGNTEYLKGAFLNELDKFDNDFFNISPREASLMDPNQRLFLENAWEAIEDAGYCRKRIMGSKTGVYIGYSGSKPTYETLLWESEASLAPESLAGNVNSMLASRIAYILDLKGPCMLVDTACSSSLMAVHLACQAIRNGECHMALAGGIKTLLLPMKTDDSENVGIASSDGKARTFDDSSDGTGIGEGAAAVLLKPLEQALNDKDHIYAVIKGSAANNDGSSIGITAPNSLAQRDAIVKAWEDSGINPETLSYIEAHGTGTKLGDPIELDGIKRAFKKYTNKKQFCAIGSVKSNIGHLDNMAGIAGLIKAVLCIQHGQIPPSLHFKRPNRKIMFEDSPVYVNDRLHEWETVGYPRRCGISSFGISGTNCHMILEEVPDSKGKLEKPQSKLQVLTLSAKNENSLHSLLKNFDEYLKKNKEVLIEDICFTQNTGRMHYPLRMALILENRRDMEEKISCLADMQPKDIQEQGVFYGFHKIVRHSEGIKNEGYISETDKKELSKTAAERLQEFVIGVNYNRGILEELCILYTKGADIDWDCLYKSENKVSIPTYPFNRKRFWIDTKRQIKEAVQESHGDRYKLPGHRISDTINQEVYTAEISVGNQWLLREHKVGGNYMLVGTAYLELAMQTSKKYYPGKAVEIRELTLLTPLIVGEEDKVELHTVIMREDGFLKFIIASKSKSAENGWIEHAQGRIYGTEKLSDKYDMTEVLQRCTDERVIEENKQKDAVVEVGKRWECLTKAFSGTNEALGYLELGEEYKGDFDEFQLHPPMLDTALNFAGGQAEKDGFYFPFHFNSVKIYNPISSKIISHVRIMNTSDRTIEYNITLVDENRRVLMEVDRYVTKKDAGQLLNKTDLLHSIEWVEYSDTAQDKAFDLVDGNKSILYFSDKSRSCNEIINRLEAKGIKVIEVNTGEEYGVLGKGKYSVGYSQEDFYQLFSQESIKDINYIVYSPESGLPDTSDIKILENKLENSVYNLFRLTKACMQKNTGKDIKIVILSTYVNSVTGNEECLNPENAALFGMAFVLKKEYPNLKIKCIDMDFGCEAESIIAEFQTVHKTRMIALRNGRRYIEQLKRVKREQNPSNSVKIRENGVYIVTGGLGGIGLEIAKHMASGTNLNVVMINRSEMPERSRWDTILETEKDLKLCSKIKSIMDIESLGSKVTYYNGDVADMQSMKLIIEDVIKNYGKINGIIHSAGIAGNGLAITKDEKRIKEVMAAKVKGTWIIDSLTSNLNMDFLLLFSSAETLTTSAGQSDYAAANYYMDTYCYYRNKRNQPTFCINWAAWKETGMAKEHNADKDGVFIALSTANGVRAFDEVLKSGQPRVIAGQLNYNLLAGLKESLPVTLEAELNAVLDRSKKTRKSDTIVGTTKQDTVDIKLTGKTTEQITKTEQVIGEIWASIFQSDEINVYDSFYDQGGDSIFAMKITNVISNTWGINISITDVMNNQSIYELGRYIDSQFTGTKQASLKSQPIGKADKSDYYPVSSSQKRLYILEQYGNIGTTYNIPVALMVEGRLDTQRVENSIGRIIQRHESLRTTFKEVNGNICQVVHEDYKPDFKYFEADEKEIEIIIRDFVKPFNLNKGPLVKTLLVKFPSDRYLLLMDFHHIVTDWASSDIIIKEFIDIYKDNELPEPGIQYKDYSVWQNQLFSTKEFLKQENYWLNIFSGDIPVLQLPVDKKEHDENIPDYTGKSISLKLGADLTERLNKFSQKQGVTLFMLLLASYNILLSKYTGQEDIIIGSPISGRIHTDVENTVGMFVNMLPMRNFPSGNKTFAGFLEEVRDNCLGAFENQDYPFEMMISRLEAQKNTKINSLFSITFALMTRREEGIDVDDFKMMPVDIPVTTSKFDLTIDAVKVDGDIAIDFRYRTALFRTDSMDNFIKYYKELLEIVIEKPEIKIEDIDFLESLEDGTSLTQKASIMDEIDFEF